MSVDYKPRPLPGFVMEGGDGNAFAIMGRFRKAAREAEVPPAVIDAVLAEARTSDYDHLLQTFLPWESEDPNDE